MIKIRIFGVGKTKEAWLETALEEYLKRLKPSFQIEFHYAKNDVQLLDWLEKEPKVIALDPAGKSLTSEQFSSFLYEQIEAGGSRLTIIIGGPEGLPQVIRQQAQLLSLSPLTFTHQLARLVLIEQLYRAAEIAKGSPYHK
jgi:23S rRNA (pseudouridine1915-N3)-methyltransferase